MQTPVTNPDPSLSFWLHISAPHPSLRPNPPALAFRLMQLLSQHPVRKPPPPLAPASVQAHQPRLLDLAPGLSPLAPVPFCCPQHGWTYPRARCGPMWHACPEYRLSALIAAIDFCPNLLP